MSETNRIRLKEIPAGGRGIKVSVNGDEVAVFRIANEIVAVSNVCPHQHFSRIHEGSLEGTVVTCPMHGWSFDVMSGACVNGAGSLKKYKITQRDDAVIVELPGT